MAGTFKVLRTDSESHLCEWLRLWNAWPQREVQAHPRYLMLYEDAKAKGACAVLTGDMGCVLYPFMVRDLRQEAYGCIGEGPVNDLITAYGYGGPFAWDVADKEALAGSFWAEFNRWARDSGVVSEVVKLSLFGDGMIPYPGTRTEVMRNIVVDLSLSQEELWMQAEHKVRKNVNKASRNGVTVTADSTGETIASFLDIYRSTLDRRNARGSYYFTPEYFARIHSGLGGCFVYLNAVHDGRIISTELVLVSAESIYSFLGGTYMDKFPLAPNDLLKFEIMKWGKRNGKRYYVIGGGQQPEDGVFRYKKSFSPNGSRAFFVGPNTRPCSVRRIDAE